MVSNFSLRRLDLDFTCCRNWHASLILRAIEPCAQLLLLLLVLPGLRVEQISAAAASTARPESTVDGFCGILCVVVVGRDYLGGRRMSTHR